jgi:hypothetical protein
MFTRVLLGKLNRGICPLKRALQREVFQLRIHTGFIKDVDFFNWGV